MGTQTRPTTDDWKRVLDAVERSLDRLGSTPEVLRKALGAAWALALLFFVVVLVGVGQHRKALNTVGQEATASITASQQIKAYLADMGSDAANELLSTGTASQQTVAEYEKRRRQVDEQLVAAAQNITYREEKPLVEQLQHELGTFEEAVARARLLHQQGDDAGALKQYRDADAILHRQADEHDKDRVRHQGLLAAAEQLDQVNRKELDGQYAGARSAATWVTLGTVLTGLGLLVTLGAVQLFLYRRMRRVLNPALLAATVLAAGFFLYTLGSFGSAWASLKTAKEDAFDSLHLLWRARADAYDANGDESRWLLDDRQADAHEKAFHDRAAQVLAPPAGKTYADLDTAARGSRVPDGLKGHLARELRNITFPGEREAATATVADFARYVVIDEQIRRLQREGKHDEAVRLCVGRQPGESNWAFDQFDASLGKAIDVNQQAFQGAIADGKETLAPIDVTAAVVCLAVAGLALVGLWPRLKEYAA